MAHTSKKQRQRDRESRHRQSARNTILADGLTTISLAECLECGAIWRARHLVGRPALPCPMCASLDTLRYGDPSAQD